MGPQAMGDVAQPEHMRPAIADNRDVSKAGSNARTAEVRRLRFELEFLRQTELATRRKLRALGYPTYTPQ